jgi:Ser/Thr protein kinase RdoA (MazF antagonist)
VVAVEALAPELGRSVLLMREIPGIALSGIADEGAARAAARGAGRDAAVMNATPVDGFGWIVRDGRRWPPKGETATYGAFAREGIPPEREHRERLLSGLFSAGELDALDEVVADAVPRPLERGSLSHGDLDVTAIHVHDGSYAGLIDFSELRGGEPEFDLGHFLLHDQETNPISLFADFLAGYREVAAADPDVDRVRRVAILVGLRQLCGSLGRGVPRSWFTRFRAAQLLNLLEGRPACAPR